MTGHELHSVLERYAAHSPTAVRAVSAGRGGVCGPVKSRMGIENHWHGARRPETDRTRRDQLAAGGPVHLERYFDCQSHAGELSKARAALDEALDVRAPDAKAGRG
jgi:hypothetical protein